MRIHESVTLDRVMSAVKRRDSSLDNPGFCVACGHEQDGCEPDAVQYECEECQRNCVYGAEELLIMMAF